MIENIKKYKYIIIILFIFLVVYFMLIFSMNKFSYEGYFVFKNFGNYRCNNKKCKEVTYKKIEDVKISYNIQTNNNHYKNYKLKYINSWNLFDENKEWKNIEEDYIAYSNDLNLKLLEINNARNVNEKEKKYINKSCKYNIKNFDNLDNNIVYEMHLNNNDKMDKIVMVGRYNVELPSNKLFNFIYIEVDGKRNILINDTYKNMDSYDVPGYMLYFVYKINEEKESIITIVENYFSNVSEPHIKMFSTKNKKIIKLN